MIAAPVGAATNPILVTNDDKNKLTIGQAINGMAKLIFIITGDPNMIGSFILNSDVAIVNFPKVLNCDDFALVNINRFNANVDPTPPISV